LDHDLDGKPPMVERIFMIFLPSAQHPVARMSAVAQTIAKSAAFLTAGAAF
jgi:hypothetical protein